MADVVYQYGANVEQILAALNQIDKTNEKVYQKAEKAANRAIKGIIADHQRLISLSGKLDKSLSDEAKAYDKIAQEANKATRAGERVATSAGGIGQQSQISATQIGLVSGAVSTLTNQFIQLGQQAVGVLQEIISKSVETAIEVDTLKARLGGIFDGSKEAADEAFNFIQDKSKELGIDLSELAGAFLPKTESLAQFERVAKIATALARSDPEQGAIGARIALIEALSGTFISLQRRFEIPKEDIDRIKEAFDKEGIEGFLTTLEQVLVESGKSFDDLANTASTTFSKVSIAGEQLGGRLGAPIVRALEDAANKILEFTSENEDDLIVFADTIGRAIADVINLVSGIDFSQFDTKTLTEIADYIFRVVEASKLALEQFRQFSEVTGLAEALAGPFELLGSIFTNIDDALYTLSQILALATAAFEATKAAVEATIAPFATLISAIDALNKGDVASAAYLLKESYDELQTALYDTSIVQDAFNASIEGSLASFQAYDSAIQRNKTAQDDLRDSLQEQKDAGTNAADSILAAAQAQRQAAEDAEKLKDAQDKVNKAMGDAQNDFQRKMEDIEIETERKRLDIQIEFAQKREDAARENLRKLEEIQTKYTQEVQDAETDLNREEQDIATKFGRERIDLEREQRQSRLDIETSYRQKLQDIQTESASDLEEAERKRDAVAYLKILRQQQEKVTEAQTDRERELENLRITGEQKKLELDLQQQRELEDAQLANERKLEDLRTNLQRQIEAQNVAYSQQLSDLATAEQRKNEELNRSRERDIEDAQKAYDRKIEDLQESLAEELAILQEGNAALEAEQARHNAAMEEATAAVEAAGGPISQQASTVTNRMNLDKAFDKLKNATYAAGRTSMLGGRQAGGSVSGGGSYLVGEKGPELFTPGSSGYITPNNALLMATPGAAGVTSISNSKSQQINIPTVPASQLLDAVFVAQMRNLISSELGKVL